MVKSFTNVETYLIILFIFAALVTGLVAVANEFISNDNANPDNDSLNYIANLNGINLSESQASKADIETPVLANANFSQGSPKDEALDFLFAKEKGFRIELTIKRIFGLPSFILIDLLRFQLNDWKWLIDIIGWVLSLVIILALIYLARGLWH